ncbi:unnamed protein product [Nezara viridula]|uniref:Uncharacterized protein n=1 Tax=Nezara viridula TaxID=85310 RepID=A0A9P0DYG0_NEZVI|nr:unnamed protein product [Nezara viridula]
MERNYTSDAVLSARTERALKCFPCSLAESSTSKRHLRRHLALSRYYLSSGFIFASDAASVAAEGGD